MTLVGFTALSVETWTTARAPKASAASATLREPSTLVATPSVGLRSTIGTCLSAAAWKTISGRSAANTCEIRVRSRTSARTAPFGSFGKLSPSSCSIA